MRQMLTRQFAALLIAGAFLLPILTRPAPAVAAGLGLSLTGSSGSTDKLFWGDGDRNFQATGVAFLLDASNPDRVFGYRLELAFDNVRVEAGLDSLIYPARDIDRFSVRHTFGFAVFRTPSMRVWLGPQVLMCWEKGPDNYSADGWGVGWAMGGDFGLAPALSLGFGVGARNVWAGNNDYDERYLAMNLVFHLGER